MPGEALLWWYVGTMAVSALQPLVIVYIAVMLTIIAFRKRP